MHWRKLVISIIFYTCFSDVSAQVVDIGNLDQEPGYIFFNGSTYALRNSSVISLDSVLQPASQQRFTPLPSQAVIFHGFDPDYFWYRFTVSNRDVKDRTFILLFGGRGIRTAELWTRANSGWYSLGKMGYRYPFSSRPFLFTSYAYPVTIPAGQTLTYYLNVDESHAYKTTHFAAFEPGTMERIKGRYYFFFGLLIGVMLLFGVFNLYLYFSIKEPIHIWYALYIIFMVCFLVKHEGLDMQFLHMDSEWAYRASSMVGFVAVGSGFLVQVVQLFLVNISVKSWLGKALSLVKWSLWLSGAIYFIIFFIEPAHWMEVVVFEWANKTAIVAILLVIVSCMYSIAKGYRPAWILLLGQAAYLIGVLFRALFIGDLSQVIPPAPFQIGLLMEVLIVSYALMHRYNVFKREKEQLGNQLRNQQLHFSEQILVTQENERKRIAGDLHDELGGNLAAIQMAVQTAELPESQRDLLKGLVYKTAVTTREIAHNLMPPDFEKSSLCEMLSIYFGRLQMEGDLRYHFVCSGTVVPFSKQDELMVYRIVMELATNISRHAQASEATIQLLYEPDALEIIVEDNGRGFQENSGEGIGLKSIRSRVDYLGGVFKLDTGQKGTTVIVHIPYQKEV